MIRQMPQPRSSRRADSSSGAASYRPKGTADRTASSGTRLGFCPRAPSGSARSAVKDLVLSLRRIDLAVAAGCIDEATAEYRNKPQRPASLSFSTLLGKCLGQAETRSRISMRCDGLATSAVKAKATVVEFRGWN
jgi:hypothetical protein